MSEAYDEITMNNTIEHLRDRLQQAPSALLVLGSGLGVLAEELDSPIRLRYDEIPGFPRSTVEGHAGALVVGRLAGVRVAVMAGRFHLYEGWSAAEVALPVRALAAIGTPVLLLTNAAGGLRPGMAAGDLMLLTDHLNLTWSNPLTGPVAPAETRFPDMSAGYDPELRRVMREAALKAGVPLEEGVYAGLPGPSYETPAEIGMLRRMGADAVGMSTVTEVVAARALGMRVAAISCITNLASGLSAGPLSHEEVLAAGVEARGRMASLLRAALPEIAARARAATADPERGG